MSLMFRVPKYADIMPWSPFGERAKRAIRPRQTVTVSSCCLFVELSFCVRLLVMTPTTGG